MIISRAGEPDDRQLHAGEELVARLQRDDAADERGDDHGERHRVDADRPHLANRLRARTSPDRRTPRAMSRRKYVRRPMSRNTSIQ